MIARNQEPPARKLDPVAGPRRIPSPPWQLHLGCDLTRWAPGCAVVAAFGDPNRVVVDAEYEDNLPVSKSTTGAGLRPLCAGQRRKEAERPPRLSAVKASSQEQVDIAVIRSAVFSSLAKSEQRSAGRHHHRGDPVL